VMMQTANENTVDVLSRGMRGGEPGKPSEVVMWPDTLREQRLVERVSGFGPLSPGDVISVRTGGGGGWGRPHDRDPQRVLVDLRDGLVDRDTAEAVYGVAIRIDGDGTMSLDAARTRALRGGGG
jgi:N-methylhydantoinase B